ncbi:MAG: hypothetical protein F6K18_22380 [Okeania sp. SIO2C2]|uniref:hypothetical protein n=1 Tax=Okeania sp. SIO2C2 TaxID=2607787 RepID=UPI0013B68E33|nr:hypothetical protein [Okeania sp. SIO2C2]NEP89359.1 hypothetical protein [Okeania sp. SIO2C2]
MINFQPQPIKAKLSKYQFMTPYFPIYIVLDKNLSYSQNFAAWLEAKITIPDLTISNSNNETLLFLLEALQVTWESEGNPEKIYPLVVENIDLLEPHLIYILRKWTKQVFPHICQNRATKIASALVNFSRIIWALPDGDSDVNLEIALACCELALEVFNFDDFPYEWAIVNHNLAVIYQTRCYGNYTHNLIKSLEHYLQAKLVFPEQSLPQQ